MVRSSQMAIALLLLGAPAFAQGAPATGAVAPASRDHVARAVAEIAKIRFARGPSLSPDGKQIAYISSASGIPQVWVVPAAGGDARQITKLTDPVQSVYWSPAGNWLAYDVAPGGGLNVQIYVVKPDGSSAKRLTAGGKDSNRLAGWTNDGKWLRIASNAAYREGFDAFLINPDSGEARAVVEKKASTKSPMFLLMADGRRSAGSPRGTTTISISSISAPVQRLS